MFKITLAIKLASCRTRITTVVTAKCLHFASMMNKNSQQIKWGDPQVQVMVRTPYCKNQYVIKHYNICCFCIDFLIHSEVMDLIWM
jgi:hypothetical protein